MSASNYIASVITPFHNTNISYFEPAFESVINQTVGVENIEWIIVVHNSEDGYYQKVKEMAKPYDSIKVYELKNDINDSLNHTYTIEGIIEDTKQLVDGFNEDERKAILFTMAAFIEKVIAADGNLECKEQDYFLQWRDAVVSA